MNRSALDGVLGPLKYMEKIIQISTSVQENGQTIVFGLGENGNLFLCTPKDKKWKFITNSLPIYENTGDQENNS